MLFKNIDSLYISITLVSIAAAQGNSGNVENRRGISIKLGLLRQLRAFSNILHLQSPALCYSNSLFIS